MSSSIPKDQTTAALLQLRNDVRSALNIFAMPRVDRWDYPHERLFACLSELYKSTIDAPHTAPTLYDTTGLKKSAATQERLQEGYAALNEKFPSGGDYAADVYEVTPENVALMIAMQRFAAEQRAIKTLIASDAYQTMLDEIKTLVKEGAGWGIDDIIIQFNHDLDITPTLRLKNTDSSTLAEWAGSPLIGNHDKPITGNEKPESWRLETLQGLVNTFAAIHAHRQTCDTLATTPAMQTLQSNLKTLIDLPGHRGNFARDFREYLTNNDKIYPDRIVATGRLKSMMHNAGYINDQHDNTKPLINLKKHTTVFLEMLATELPGFIEYYTPIAQQSQEDRNAARDAKALTKAAAKQSLATTPERPKSAKQQATLQDAAGIARKAALTASITDRIGCSTQALLAFRLHLHNKIPSSWLQARTPGYELKKFRRALKSGGIDGIEAACAAIKDPQLLDFLNQQISTFEPPTQIISKELAPIQRNPRRREIPTLQPSGIDPIAALQAQEVLPYSGLTLAESQQPGTLRRALTVALGILASNDTAQNRIITKLKEGNVKSIHQDGSTASHYTLADIAGGRVKVACSPYKQGTLIEDIVREANITDAFQIRYQQQYGGR